MKHCTDATQCTTLMLARNIVGRQNFRGNAWPVYPQGRLPSCKPLHTLSLASYIAWELESASSYHDDRESLSNGPKSWAVWRVGHSPCGP